MATPSPADSPAADKAAPPARVEHHDGREAFIPPSSLNGRYETGAGSISRTSPTEEVTSLRIEGADPVYGSYRPKTVPGGHAGDVLVLIGVILAAVGYLVWRHFREEMQENFAGQDHNKD